MGEFDGNTMRVDRFEGNIALQGSDKDLVVLFYAGTRVNPIKSTQQGVPIYDPVDMIRVYHPGEPLNVPERPVIESDKYRFKQQWEMFKQGKDQKAEGTPLSALFPGNPEIVKTLDAIHISTVQQLANISDTATQNMMFGVNLRDKAKEFLAVHQGSAEYHKIQKDLEERDFKIKELSEQIALLMAEKKAAPVAVQQPDQSAAIAALTNLVAGLQVQMAEKPKRNTGWPKGKKRKTGKPDIPAEEPSAA